MNSSYLSCRVILIHVVGCVGSFVHVILLLAKVLLESVLLELSSCLIGWLLRLPDELVHLYSVAEVAKTDVSDQLLYSLVLV